MPPAAGGLRPPDPPMGRDRGGEGGRVGWTGLGEGNARRFSAKTPKYLRAVGPVLWEGRQSETGGRLNFWANHLLKTSREIERKAPSRG